MDLSAADLAVAVAILARHVPGREVRVFGSRATGRGRPFSDLDLALMGDERLDAVVRATLAESFAESDLRFLVDVVEWSTANDALRAAIGRDGVTLPRSPAEVDERHG